MTTRSGGFTWRAATEGGEFRYVSLMKKLRRVRVGAVVG